MYTANMWWCIKSSQVTCKCWLCCVHTVGQVLQNSEVHHESCWSQRSPYWLFIKLQQVDQSENIENGGTAQQHCLHPDCDWELREPEGQQSHYMRTIRFTAISSSTTASASTPQGTVVATTHLHCVESECYLRNWSVCSYSGHVKQRGRWPAAGAADPVFIYIYIEREREREICTYIYTYRCVCVCVCVCVYR